MPDISIHVADHIAVVTLDRPPINSLVKSTYLELRDAFDSLGDMEGVRVAVLRAEGRLFCPGNDVSEFDRIADAEEVKSYSQAVSDGVSSIYNCKVPVIAAVHGHAYGAGMAIAACADVLVAAEDMEFGIPEIKVGIIGAAGFMRLLVPEKVARYLSLYGEAISAREVQRYGGVHSIVPAEQVLETAMGLARELLQRGPTALRYFKEAMNHNHDARLVEQYAYESSFTRKYVGTPEFTEAVRAFLERRTPDFK